MSDPPDELVLSEDGFSLPTVEVLTGRGFITGKSGSGKSNTASVVAEELLAADLPFLVVDTEGEYYGLKEQYELLHVGGDDQCDLQVGPDHAEQLAAVALEQGVPVILDTSGFDPGTGRELVGAVVAELFAREKTARLPFLLVVEEAHEFIPERTALDEVGETIVRVAKRGRKRGLGVCAVSQRPASVSKDYITQCDWLVWHRLTWDNDTKVVSRILGSDAAADVRELADGEAVVATDWDGEVRRVQLRRKHTFDAGAAPDLSDVERPDLTDVDRDRIADLVAAVESGSDGTSRTEDGDATGTTSDPSTDTRATADGGSGDGRHGGSRQPDAAADPTWEAAQFLTYLAERLVAALVGLAVGVGRAGIRVAEWTAGRVARTPTERRRVETAVRALLVVGLGLVLVAVVALLA